jgi:hypothetical protein
MPLNNIYYYVLKTEFYFLLQNWNAKFKRIQNYPFLHLILNGVDCGKINSFRL